MRMKSWKLLAIAITWAVIAGLSLCAGADNLIIRRDEPLQTTWIIPRKPTEARGRGGILANRWKLFPFIGQTFREDKKWLTLSVRFGGIGRIYTSNLIFAVDGATTTISDVSWVRRQPDFDYWDIATLHGQENLIRKIAQAKEVWVTAATAAGRASVKLSPQQVTVFGEVLEKYDSLPPAAQSQQPATGAPTTQSEPPGASQPVVAPVTAPAVPSAGGLVPITFASNPPGAIVSFSGMGVCYTPCVTKLEPRRRHKVKMTLAGYVDWTGEINIEPGKPATVVAELQPQP